MTIRPRRSVLYMPGSNARALEKARTIPADTLILDLEDAVAPQAKELARRQVCDAVRSKAYGGRELLIRVNGLGTPWFADDVQAAVAAGPDAIVLPKASSAADIGHLTLALAQAGAPQAGALKAGALKALGVWAMIETPRGVLNAAEIASAGPACLIVGLNDLFKETHAEPDANRTAAQYWLSHIVTVARAYGLDVLDSAYNNFRDTDGFRRECLQGRMLGFDGKTLIHPDQVAAANEVFAPPVAEVEWARKIIAAFQRPENRGKGVIDLEGRMVELLHREMAKRTVAIADAIAARG